ncbi:hypothetical protein [Shewanella algae]|uniref:ankyrin repeat domain-containing protein n=1 Tax=Shewanella algae TaxID=38313 RepID=UPI00313AC831
MEHFTEDSRSLGGALKDHILNLDLVAISQIVSTDNVDHSLVQDGLRQCRPLDFVLEQADPKFDRVVQHLLKLGAGIRHLLDKERKPNHLLQRALRSAEMVQMLSEQEVNLNILWQGEFNLLSLATCRGDYRMVKAVLEQQLALLDDECFFWHCFSRNPALEQQTVQLLLSHGIEYQGSEEREYCDSLLFQLFNSPMPELKILSIFNMLNEQQYDCDLERRYSGNTLLAMTIKNGQRLLLTRLVELGADISHHQPEVARMLLNKEKLQSRLVLDDSLDLFSADAAEVERYLTTQADFTGKSVIGPILCHTNLSSSQRCRFAELAIAKGADVNQAFAFTTAGGTELFCTPLYALCSMEQDRLDEVALLLRHGAVDPVENRSALFLTISQARLELLKVLLQGGINPNFALRGEPVNENCRMDDEMWVSHFYPSHLRVKPNPAQKRAMFSMLQEAGLSSLLQTDSAWTALDIALLRRDHEFVQQMLGEGFQPPLSPNTLNWAFEYCSDLATLETLIALSDTQVEVTEEMVSGYFHCFANKPEETSQDREAIFELLLRLGLDLQRQYDGGSLLELAIRTRNEPVIRRLLQLRQQFQIPADAVAWAIHSLQSPQLVGDIVALFPDFELADVHQSFSGNHKAPATAITLALHKKRWSLAQYLLQRFPTMRAWTEVRWLTEDVLWELEEDGLELFRLLIEREQDLDRLCLDGNDACRWSLLYFLCFRYAKLKQHKQLYLSAVEILLEAGAAVDQPYSLDVERTPTKPDITHIFSCILYDAENDFEYCRPMFDLLIDYGVDPTVPVGQFHESGVMSTVQRYHSIINEETSLKFVRYLWQRTGFNIHEVNNLGNNLIFAAAMPGRSKLLRWFAEHGADIHHVGGFDHSNAMHKCLSNYSDINPIDRAKTVAALLDLGMDIEVLDPDPDSRATPLMTACTFGIQSCIDLLLSRGANINAVSPLGDTPLLAAITSQYCYDAHSSVEASKKGLVTQLVQQGAKINQLTPGRSHPLLEAAFADRPGIFECLLELGADPWMLDPNLKSESSGSIGFVKPQTPDADGMNPLGFLLMHGEKARQYLQIIARYYGDDVIVSAIADLEAMRPPVCPAQAAAKLAELQQPKPQPSQTPQAPGAEIEPSLTFKDNETRLKFRRIIRQSVTLQGISFSLDLAFEETRALGAAIEAQCPGANMNNPVNWQRFICAVFNQRAPELAQALQAKDDEGLCVFEVEPAKVSSLTQVQALGQLFRELFATPRAVLGALEEVQHEIEWQAASAATSAEDKTTEDSAQAPDEAVPLDLRDLYQIMANFGFVNVIFKLDSTTMKQLAASVQSLLPLEMNAEDWSRIIQAICQNQFGEQTDLISFEAIGNYFRVVLEDEPGVKHELVKNFRQLLRQLFHTEQSFMQQVMAVRQHLPTEA